MSPRFSGYFFKTQDELDSLMGLGAAQLKVYLVISRAIQRDRNRGLISIRQIAKRAHGKSIGHTQEAVDALCAAGFFTRHNPYTGKLLKEPKEWKSRQVEYRQPITWKSMQKQEDTGKVALPQCKPATETRSLGEAEVRRLWDTTEGRSYMVWRVLILTGARIGEVLALTRGDLLPEGLRIDESAEDGKPGPTKNRKTRVVPLPDALRAEVVEWLTTHDSNLMFPSPKGKIQRRSDGTMMTLLKRARTAANIPDLKFRMCRTTFATLFEGDIRDAQAMLGHHSPTFTLQVYRKPVTARQLAAVNDLEKRLHVVPRRQAS